jgi:tetratricopeptide (TPR) repeat protein
MRRILPLIVAGLVMASCASPSSPTPVELEGAPAYIERGESLIAAGRYLDAIDDFSAALQLEPDNSETYFLRGRAHFDYACEVIRQETGGTAQVVTVLPDEAVQHLEEAVADYTSTIDLDPQNARAYNNRANAHASLGDEEAALADYDAALGLDSSLSLTYFNRGFIHYRAGNNEQAIADFEKYLELVPDAEDRAEVEGFIAEMLGSSSPAP